ncbi:MAG TPA: anaerobic glycerol-3-phosphate dehydrogenase subunit C [Candidatus Limnocylindria bacterium]|nr:anaerobic glycerol-3-phosphate dehydrogenase subunit C [Candidatus Limnocylindria bacterium]
MTFHDAAAREFPPFSTDACIKCTVCQTVCPVARVTDAFPGPKYVGPQAQRFRGPASDHQVPDHTVDLCSGCGICTRACPAGVLIAETNNRARAAMVAERGASVRNRLISDTDLLARLGVPLAPLANLGLRSRALRWIGEKVLGVHRRGPLAPFARRTFGSVWRRRGGLTALPAGADPERTVAYFHGCAVNGFEPGVGEDAVAILERNGFTVIVPKQECCGLPFISNGLYDQARRKARRNLAELAHLARAGVRIVGTSTSCTHALKAEYREMLDLDDADARAVADATWDICELLVDLHDRGELDTAFGPMHEALPYHPPCQLRSHGIGTPAMDLFALVPGLRATDQDHDCCGAAGTYGLKAERWQIAQDVGAPLFAKIRSAAQAGARQAACDSETCRWQIQASTGVRTRHPVEILAEAYRRGDPATDAGLPWRRLV